MNYNYNEFFSKETYPVHYCGINLKELLDMPEDIFPYCQQFFDEKAQRNIEESKDSWYKPGGKLDIMWKEVNRLSKKDEKDFFEMLIETLKSSDLVRGFGHLAEWMQRGIISSF